MCKTEQIHSFKHIYNSVGLFQGQGDDGIVFMNGQCVCVCAWRDPHKGRAKDTVKFLSVENVITRQYFWVREECKNK